MIASAALLSNPIVLKWIETYKEVNSISHAICDKCGFPHYKNILCGRGAIFGAMRLGSKIYWIDASNVEYFISFYDQAQKDNVDFKRDIQFSRKNSKEIEIFFYENYNNIPQKNTCNFSSQEWELVVNKLKVSQ